MKGERGATYNLTSTRRPTRQNLMRNPNLPILAREMASHEIINRKLDSLLGRHTHKLRYHPRIQALEPFIPNHLLRAIKRVLI